MADIADIEGLILRAQAEENDDPRASHGKYEVAERELEEFLIKSFGATKQALYENPSSGLSGRFLVYFKVIDEGYQRLTKQQEQA
jgi:hypothetical protein